MMLRMHSTMSQRSPLPKNHGDVLPTQRADGGEERSQLGGTSQVKPVIRDWIPSSHGPAAKTQAAEAETQQASEGVVPAGREARFRSDLDQVAQQLRGIQFGSLVITIQDGVVVQLDRTERTRLRKPQLSSNAEGDLQQGSTAHSQSVRRDPRHPDC